jgi:hypothetical protein
MGWIMGACCNPFFNVLNVSIAFERAMGKCVPLEILVKGFMKIQADIYHL